MCGTKTLDSRHIFSAITFPLSGKFCSLVIQLEVIYTIIIAKGYTLNEAEQIRKTKLANNGGFSNRIFLLEVEE